MQQAAEIEEASIASAIASYSRDRGRYEKLCAYVCSLISDHCGSGRLHTTEHRAKTAASFDKKCRKRDDDGKLRYPRPLEQLTDLAGVRVIVFIKDSVDVVCAEIDKLFEVVEQEDVGERVYRKGKFGYQSKHLLIRLGEDRRALVENADIKNLVCEIQVRTLLQHAWAEMEHDIQYKSEVDVPLDLNKRFSALAGLLEIADREFESIQRDSEALKRAVKEDLITDLTQQSLSEGHDLGAGDPVAHLAMDARDLISQGMYQEAIDIYSSKISSEPNSYTLFIGRARARFLAGDVRGAVADLDQADYLTGDFEYTTRLRGIIEKGDDPRKALRSSSAQKSVDERQLASQFMREGDGLRAFDEYSNLEAGGYNRAFSLFGKAMACALERDVQGARSFLAPLEIRPSTPMSVNICALQCIIGVLSNEGSRIDFAMVDQCLGDAPHFELKLSLLDDLRAGFRAKEFAEQDRIELVFERLTRNSEEHSLALV